jgi:hypothetical protein
VFASIDAGFGSSSMCVRPAKMMQASWPVGIPRIRDAAKREIFQLLDQVKDPAIK